MICQKCGSIMTRIGGTVGGTQLYVCYESTCKDKGIVKVEVKS